MRSRVRSAPFWRRLLLRSGRATPPTSSSAPTSRRTPPTSCARPICGRDSRQPTGTVDTGGAELEPKRFSFFGSARRRAPRPARPPAGSRRSRGLGRGLHAQFRRRSRRQCRQVGARRHPRRRLCHRSARAGLDHSFVRAADRQEGHAVCARERAARQQSEHGARRFGLSHRAGQRRRPSARSTAQAAGERRARIRHDRHSAAVCVGNDAVETARRFRHAARRHSNRSNRASS